MATIKSYTDLEQSKKLAEILSLESSDMIWILANPDLPFIRAIAYKDSEKSKHYEIFPAWSLAALLNILPYPQLSKDKLGSGKVGWIVSVYPNDCRYDFCWNDNPLDACYEMILKLNELNLL